MQAGHGAGEVVLHGLGHLAGRALVVADLFDLLGQGAVGRGFLQDRAGSHRGLAEKLFLDFQPFRGAEVGRVHRGFHVLQDRDERPQIALAVLCCNAELSQSLRGFLGRCRQTVQD